MLAVPSGSLLYLVASIMYGAGKIPENIDLKSKKGKEEKVGLRARLYLLFFLRQLPLG
jgi:hypothetical protein